MQKSSHRIVQTGQVGVAILQPLVELHGVVRRITFAVGCQTEDCQRVWYGLEVHKFLLERKIRQT